MGALDVSKGTVKSIYALGAKLGMVERGGGHADALHALVQGLTGKESITALTPAEAQAVLAELRRRSAPAAAPQKKRARKYEALPGGLSEGQQKKVWYLMYQLEKYDPAPEGVQLRDRLCGLISRQFGVTAFPTQPFRFLSFSQGNALIEGLKSLAERKELEYLHSDRSRRERLNELKLEDLQGEARELAETIGMDAFRRLVDVYGGTGRVYIPQADKLLIPIRDRLIRDEYNGSNVYALCKKWNLSEGYVRGIVREKTEQIRRAPLDGQCTLFDV